jgi:putative hydrolase of the HAD superfamily
MGRTGEDRLHGSAWRRPHSHSMKIRSVVFDFGNVICFPPAPEKIERAAAEAELPVDEFLAAMWKDRLPYDGGISPQEYWKGVAAHASTKFDDLLISRMVEHEIGFWNTFDARVLDWILTLRRNGLTIGILSNLPHPIASSLRSTPGFMEHFDHVTFSCDLRLFKPQSAIYEHSFRGLGVAPEETLFIDDKIENVEAARAAGMNAELFTTWEEFVKVVPARYELPVPRRQ